MVVSVHEIRALVTECLALRKYVNCVHRLFGWSQAETEARAQQPRVTQLLGLERGINDPERWQSYAAANDIDELVAALKQDRHEAAKNREFWKSKPIPIRCDDATLETLALRVEHGPPVILTKAEIETHFDFSSAVHFWEWIPEYTTIWFAFGMHLSYPDADLFRSMAFFHNEAVRASQGVESALSEMAQGRDRRASLFSGLRMKKLFACQAIVNACLLVEAFLNGLASVALSKNAGSLSRQEELFLREVQRKGGVEKQRFVSTQDKLAEWVKLISPRKVGLDRGRSPFQDFDKALELRHAIVHLAASKVNTYESLDHKEATRTTDAAVAVIREICRCLAVDPARPSYPGWLKDRGPDGFFQSDSDRAANSD